MTIDPRTQRLRTALMLTRRTMVAAAIATAKNRALARVELRCGNLVGWAKALYRARYWHRKAREAGRARNNVLYTAHCEGRQIVPPGTISPVPCRTKCPVDQLVEMLKEGGVDERAIDLEAIKSARRDVHTPDGGNT